MFGIGGRCFGGKQRIMRGGLEGGARGSGKFDDEIGFRRIRDASRLHDAGRRRKIDDDSRFAGSKMAEAEGGDERLGMPGFLCADLGIDAEIRAWYIDHDPVRRGEDEGGRHHRLRQIERKLSVIGAVFDPDGGCDGGTGGRVRTSHSLAVGKAMRGGQAPQAETHQEHSQLRGTPKPRAGMVFCHVSGNSPSPPPLRITRTQNEFVRLTLHDHARRMAGSLLPINNRDDETCQIPGQPDTRARFGLLQDRRIRRNFGLSARSGRSCSGNICESASDRHAVCRRHPDGNF